MSIREDRPLLVMGAGAWGTAMAIAIARAGRRVFLWGRDTTAIAGFAHTRENSRYLPGAALPDLLQPLPDLKALPAGTDTVVLATPLQSTREMLALAKLHGLSRFVCTAKGIETGSGRLVHEIVADAAPECEDVAIVSGPSFAREVAEGRPTALAVASASGNFAKEIATSLHSPSLRPYLTDDVAGVAVGGAVKNVLAIAAGIGDGLRLGANSRAALITRGLAEMARLGEALGGRRETFMGLAGLGDLVLTCTDDQSRNRRFGLALGQGHSPQEAEATVGLVEGLPTAQAVTARAMRCQVDMPICAQVARTVRGDCSPAEAVQALMTRELKLAD
ncbi:MAG: NAD(P)-dependent glycerol-3-phosphate dehydrogenase [Gammaproteobacteria bacterium]|nr:NAD(P)-dependent glycerol-3-phosphate dehydrogenase [Gammaproteobacteria bacterium]